MDEGSSHRTASPAASAAVSPASSGRIRLPRSAAAAARTATERGLLALAIARTKPRASRLAAAWASSGGRSGTRCGSTGLRISFSSRRACASLAAGFVSNSSALDASPVMAEESMNCRARRSRQSAIPTSLLNRRGNSSISAVATASRAASPAKSGFQWSKAIPISTQEVRVSESAALSRIRSSKQFPTPSRRAGSRPTAAWTAKSARFRSCRAVMGRCNASSMNNRRTRSCPEDRQPNSHSASISGSATYP